MKVFVWVTHACRSCGRTFPNLKSGNLLARPNVDLNIVDGTYKCGLCTRARFNLVVVHSKPELSAAALARVKL